MNDYEYKMILDNKITKLTKLSNGLGRCTYFPMEKKYQIYFDIHPISTMQKNKLKAIDEAIKILKNPNDYMLNILIDYLI